MTCVGRSRRGRAGRSRARRGPRRPRGRDLRLPGAQRGRQDDDPPDARDPAAADRRAPPPSPAPTSPASRRPSAERIGYVPQGGSTDPADDRPRRAGLPGPPLRDGQADGAGVVPPRCSPRSTSSPPLTGRPARTRAACGAASTSASGIIHRPGRPVPRRADHRSRPAGPGPDVGRDPPPSREGTTVFLTTHYLEEADALGDRLAIIDHGLIVAEGTADELKRQVAGDVVTIGVDGDAERRPRDRARASPSCARRPPRTSSSASTSTSGDTAVPQLIRVLDAAGSRPDASRSRRPSLDDVFLRQTGRSLRDEAGGLTRRPAHRSDLTKGTLRCRLLRDTWLIFQRSLWLTLRNPSGSFFGLIQPILYLVLFGPLLKARRRPPGTEDGRVQLVRARAAHPARDVRRRFVGLRAHRRAARRRRRADARHADEPRRDAPRAVAARRRDPASPRRS